MVSESGMTAPLHITKVAVGCAEIDTLRDRMEVIRLSGYLEVAKPLTHPDVDGRKNFTLFAELTQRF